MQTTEVPASKSANEITTLLVQAGARQISTEYGNDGKIVGLRFVLVIYGKPWPFDIPARTNLIYKKLIDNRVYAVSSSKEREIREDAERIGWRQLFRWVQAQLAMIETGMVAAHEVFMPYALDRGGRTMFQVFDEDMQRALPPAPEEK